jgi:putative tricarboxylic transport membrane protein
VHNSDIVSGILLTVLGLITIFVIVPNQISGSSGDGIGPDVFPLTLIWATTLFAIVLCVGRLLRSKELDDPFPITWREVRFVALMAAFLAAIVAVIAYLGFIVGAIIAIAILMIVMGEFRHKLRLFLVSTILPTLLYVIFWNIFHIPLP